MSLIKYRSRRASFTLNLAALIYGKGDQLFNTWARQIFVAWMKSPLETMGDELFSDDFEWLQQFIGG